MSRVLLIFGVGLLLMAASGCSFIYEFNVEITILDASNDQPLGHGQAVLDTTGTTPTREQLDRGETLGQTDIIGRVEKRLRVSDAFRPTDERRWYLKVSRDGYQPEVVDVSPVEWPKSKKQVTPIIMTVRLKRAP